MPFSKPTNSCLAHMRVLSSTVEELNSLFNDFYFQQINNSTGQRGVGGGVLRCNQIKKSGILTVITAIILIDLQLLVGRIWERKTNVSTKCLNVFPSSLSTMHRGQGWGDVRM